jgi:putative transposase
MAHHGQARRPRQHHANLPAVPRPGAEPGRNVWQYLRQNWLSNTVFENHDAIVDAAYAAWRKLIAQPETITSIGMRDWAHVGQPL